MAGGTTTGGSSVSGVADGRVVDDDGFVELVGVLVVLGVVLELLEDDVVVVGRSVVRVTFSPRTSTAGAFFPASSPVRPSAA